MKTGLTNKDRMAKIMSTMMYGTKGRLYALRTETCKRRISWHSVNLTQGASSEYERTECVNLALNFIGLLSTIIKKGRASNGSAASGSDIKLKSIYMYMYMCVHVCMIKLPALSDD